LNKRAGFNEECIASAMIRN